MFWCGRGDSRHLCCFIGILYTFWVSVTMLLTMFQQAGTMNFMRAKVVLLARVRTEAAKYPFFPVEIKKARPSTLGNTMGYYLRYSENGGRVVRPVGANIEQAFVSYQNKEMAFARSRNGLLPIATLEPAQGRVSIADAVTKYLKNLESAVLTGEKSK